VNPGLTALLACAGQRHHIPTGTSELSWLPEAITPRNASRLSFSLSINRNYPANPFRKYMPWKPVVGSGWCTKGARGSALCRASSCGKAPAAKEQMDPGSKKLRVCAASPDFLSQKAAATGGAPAASWWHQEPQYWAVDGDHHHGLKPSEPPAPGCPCGLSWCWHLLVGRGLAVL